MPCAEDLTCAKARGSLEVLPRKPRGLCLFRRRDSVYVSEATPATSLGKDVTTECGLNGRSWARWIVPSTSWGRATG